MMLRKWLVFVVSAVLLAGCVIIITPAPKVEDAHLLGTAYQDVNFETNGQFYLSVVAITEEGDVIELSKSNISAVVDSSYPAGSYSVSVNDVTQHEVTQKSVAVGLLLDSSGSMDWNDPDETRKTAAKEFIRRLYSNSSNHLAGIFDFAARYGDANNDGIDDYYFRVICDYRQVSDTVTLFSAVDSVTASGGTPLYLATKYLLQHTYNNVSTTYHRALLVLTDGYDNESSPVTSDTVVNLSQSYSIPVFGIGLGDDVDEEFPDAIRRTGGVYANASDAEALEDIFTAMGLGLAQGYTEITLTINPIPQSGTIIYGHLNITSGGNTVTCLWILEVQ